MKQDPDNQNPTQVDLERLIAEITVDAHGDDEQLWAFQQAFQDKVSVPCDGFVIGHSFHDRCGAGEEYLGKRARMMVITWELGMCVTQWTPIHRQECPEV
jgi:hypothetical protein